MPIIYGGGTYLNTVREARVDPSTLAVKASGLECENPLHWLAGIGLDGSILHSLESPIHHSTHRVSTIGMCIGESKGYPHGVELWHLVNLLFFQMSEFRVAICIRHASVHPIFACTNTFSPAIHVFYR